METRQDDHRKQALHIHGMLTEELQTLTLLQEQIKGYPHQSMHEEAHLDWLALAIDYLQQCLNALEAAAHALPDRHASPSK